MICRHCATTPSPSHAVSATSNDRQRFLRCCSHAGAGPCTAPEVRRPRMDAASYTRDPRPEWKPFWGFGIVVLPPARACRRVASSVAVARTPRPSAPAGELRWRRGRLTGAAAPFAHDTRRSAMPRLAHPRARKARERQFPRGRTCRVRARRATFGRRAAAAASPPTQSCLSDSCAPAAPAPRTGA